MILSKIKNKRIQIVSFIFFVISISLFLWSVVNFRKILDSDMSAELILGNILAKENKLFATTSWTYSTQFRALDFPFIYGLLFRFISNWTQVHIIGILIVNVIVLVLIYWLCNLLNQKDWYFFVAGVYMLPTCFDTSWFFHTGLWYEIYVIYTISIICLLFKYIDTKQKGIFICAMILSFIYSLEGIRIIVIIYLPLLCAACINYLLKTEKRKDVLFFSLCALLCSVAGYLVYKLYITNNYFGTFIDANTISFNVSFDRIKRYFHLLFYSVGGNYTIIGILIFIVSLLAVLFNIKRKDNRNLLFISLFYIINFVIVSGSSVFSSNPLRTRYLLQATIYSLIIIVITIYTIKKPLKEYLILIVIIISILMGVQAYNDYFSRDKSTELEYISSQLVDRGYLNGYSTYWSADILTELSNGKIEVWFWGDEYNIEDSFRDIDRMHPCIQLKSHSSVPPEGKVFVLLDNGYNSRLKDLIWHFTENDILFKTDNYVIYCFDSYGDLKEKTKIE